MIRRAGGAAHKAEARKAFAAAVLANKDKPAAPARATDDDILDPEEPAPIAARADVVKAKADAAPVAAKPPEPAAAPVVAPPAPSLDPEVRRMREQLKQREEQLLAREAEIEKRSKQPEPAAVAPAAADIEKYLDNAPSWLRETFDSMRGEKMSDEDFKSEVADLITMLSGDVLGVPLPESVRVKLEAAQAKKMVRTHKTILSRREQEAKAKAERDQAEAQTKAETERVESEWRKAGETLTAHLRTDEPAKAYPWLAAEDDPGGAIVDVIRTALAKDGTKLAWHEAAKLANDYLAENAKRYYDKRKPLLSGAPEPKPAAPKPVEAAPPPAPKPAAVPTPSGNTRWNNDKHREQTRAAFRAQLAGKTD